MQGQYASLHEVNRKALTSYNHLQFAFTRWSAQEKLIVVSNFDSENSAQYQLEVPAQLINQWQLSAGQYQVEDLLYGATNILTVRDDKSASIDVKLAPLASFVFQLQAAK